MTFLDDMNAEVGKILKERWTVRDGRGVPESKDVNLDNDAVRLDGTVLYADLADSTDLVTQYKPEVVGKIYKAYLNIACRIIRKKGGEITAFDGDRVMAVFLGQTPDTDAALAALAINHAVVKVINPALRKHFALSEQFSITQAVGIDTGSLFVARAGIRNANDLVWVGPAANIAAKLCSLRDGTYASWITEAVHKKLHVSASATSDGRPMWDLCSAKFRSRAVFRSNWMKAL